MRTEKFEIGYNQTIEEIKKIGWQSTNDKYNIKYKNWPVDSRFCELRKGAYRALLDTITTAK